MFVDSNVLLDVATDDRFWREWSVEALSEAELAGPLFASAIVYAEVSVSFSRIELVSELFSEMRIEVVEATRDALFLAGKVFQKYRSRGGPRTRVLPDFLIGAQAAIAG